MTKPSGPITSTAIASSIDPAEELRAVAAQRPQDVARAAQPLARWVENKGVPRLGETLAAGDVAITFVNHATFLIQTDGVTLLTDPVWSARVSPFRRVGPKRVRAPAWRSRPAAIDIILLSHNHYDHLTLRR